ncbi:hypothetical protein BH10ACI2_BH10ACI2_07310 [soil metagenome]
MKLMRRLFEIFPKANVKRLEAVTFVLGCVVFAYAFTMIPKSTSAAEPLLEAGTLSDVDPAAPQDLDYSKFGHSNPAHTRLPCLLCHRRDDNSTRIKFPGKVDHLPCAGCHQAQLADSSSPMCTICHSNAATGAMKVFPRLKSFSARFDHSRHARQTNCATCHKSTGKGVAFSKPSGALAHNTCFQCHTSQTPIGACNTCHSPGSPPRTSEWAKAFTVNFSHQEHIRKGNMNCATCHSIRPGSARGAQVSSPLASMHFARAGTPSCAACHNSKRAFGPSDFTNCKRCHEGRNFKF